MKSSRSPKTPKKKVVRLAIFDIDGTIFRSSLLIELFNELIRRGVFPQKASSEVEREYVAWLDRKGHYNDYLIKLVKVHSRYQTGCSVGQIETAIRTVVSRQKDRVYRYTRELITELKQKGYFLMTISNSPHSLVQQFSETLGFDAAIGREQEVVDGTYTGQNSIDGTPLPTISHIDKIATLERFLERHGLRLDRARSIMVGDSEGDLPLLSYVGHPIAFNPSAPLAKIARQRGWQIVVERKDVVYNIKETTLLPIGERQRARVPYIKRTS